MTNLRKTVLDLINLDVVVALVACTERAEAYDVIIASNVFVINDVDMDNKRVSSPLL